MKAFELYDQLRTVMQLRGTGNKEIKVATKSIFVRSVFEPAYVYLDIDHIDLEDDGSFTIILKDAIS